MRRKIRVRIRSGVLGAHGGESCKAYVADVCAAAQRTGEAALFRGFAVVPLYAGDSRRSRNANLQAFRSSFFCIFGRRSFQKRCEDVFESLAASSVSSIRVTEMKSFV